MRGLSIEGNLRFKIDWASSVGKKFTVLSLFYFVFEDNFQIQASGGFIFGGAILTEGFFFALRVWGAYILRGLFSEFYGIPYTDSCKLYRAWDKNP